jgi:hypothetical protein
MGLNDKDVEDITAWYQTLGKPILVNPALPVKGDEDTPIPPQLPTLPVIPPVPMK